MGLLKLLAKTFVLVSLAALSMGNEGCEEKKPEAPRELKRIVEVGKFLAKPVVLPDGQVFDLEFVVNQQFPDVLVSSGQFVVINRNILDDGQSLEQKSSFFSTSSKVAMTDAQLNTFLGQAAAKAIKTKDGECLINLPQWRLGGAVNSYEWTDGYGLRVGYTPAGSSTNVSVGAYVKFQKAEMDVSVRAFHPYDRRLVESANITKDQYDTTLNFSVDFGQISIGPEFYFREGLASVARKALMMGIEALRKMTDKHEWYTRIVYREEGFPIIRGGKDIGLQKGDVFTVHNASYFWDNEEGICDPDHYQGRVDGPAIATGVVEDVGDYLSMLKIDDKSIVGNEDPKTGSIIKLVRLAIPEKPVQK